MNSKLEDIIPNIDVSVPFISCFESAGLLTIDEADEIMQVNYPQ